MLVYRAALDWTVCVIETQILLQPSDFVQHTLSQPTVWKPLQ